MKIIKLPLSAVPRALRICFMANQPCALWGRRGFGKSSVVAQSVPKGWGFYDFRASDKEAPDIGGIPYPKDGAKKGDEAKVRYLMSDLLPFDTDEKCVVLFDEFDRTSDLSVQNAMLQLLLDRKINGHSLSPNARIVIAGNGATDVGTIPLSKAAAGRMVHLYIETDDEQSRNGWIEWAQGNGVSPALMSLAKYRSDVWTGNVDSNGQATKSSSALDVGELEEYGSPTPRTFVMADKLWQASRTVNFQVDDIMLALLTGCVGTGAGIAMHGWYKTCDKVPAIEDIIAAPDTTRLPGEHGVYFALGITLSRYAGSKQDDKATDAIARYIARWDRELAQFAFNHLLKCEPRAATSAAYMQWEKQTRN